MLSKTQSTELLFALNFEPQASKADSGRRPVLEAGIGFTVGFRGLGFRV